MNITRTSERIFGHGHRLRTVGALVLAFIALYGGSLPNDTRSEWFRTLTRPDELPRQLERLIPFIWLTLFMLGGVGLAKIAAVARPMSWKWAMGGLLVVQLALNYGYSYTFTMLRDIPNAFWIAIILTMVTMLIIVLAVKARVWLTALFFTPYFIWVSFATYITYLLARLNP